MAGNSTHRRFTVVRLAAAASVIAATGLIISSGQVEEIEDMRRSLSTPLSEVADPHSTSRKLSPFQFIGPYDNRNNKKARAARYDGCMRYECAKGGEAHCQGGEDHHQAETDYDHPTNPPCCTHILRDMIRLIDEAFVSLDVKYFAAYGTLLGLVRNDSVIPWTADNDFVMPFASYEEVIRNRDRIREQYGLHLTKDMYLRACTAENFMGGALARWKTTKLDGSIARKGNYGNFLPYADLFIGDVDPSSGMFIDERACGFESTAIHPAKRIPVYNGTFHVNVPNDYVAVLEGIFGPEWRTPSGGTPHGNTRCEHKLFWRRGEEDTRWLDMWNRKLGRVAD